MLSLSELHILFPCIQLKGVIIYGRVKNTDPHSVDDPMDYSMDYPMDYPVTLRVKKEYLHIYVNILAFMIIFGCHVGTTIFRAIP